MASRLLLIGVRCPFSNCRTVLRPTLARLASSSCDQSSHARAARLCSGESMRYRGDATSICQGELFPLTQPRRTDKVLLNEMRRVRLLAQHFLLTAAAR